MRCRCAALTAFPSVLLLLAGIAALSQAASGPRRALQQAWASAAAFASSDGTAFASASTSSGGYAAASAVASSVSAVSLAFADAVSGTSSWDAFTWNANDSGKQQHQAGQDGFSNQQQDWIKSFGSMLDSTSKNGVGSSQQQQDTLKKDESGSNDDNRQQQQQPRLTPTHTTAPSDGLSWYAQQSLDRHNMYRQRHNTPTLRWSSSLEADAQSWANRCVFEHSQGSGQGSGQGENLAWNYHDPISALDAYYAEGANYVYGVSQPSDWRSVGHFTQMIWVSTTDLGCAVASCNGGQLFHVCRYYPPGNVQGQYANNVLPPTS